MKDVYKIILTGGGTAGSVTPLLAIADDVISGGINGSSVDFCWIGTKNGVEKKLVSDSNIKYKEIFSGKLRRYFDLKNFSDLFLIVLGFFQSVIFIAKWRPDLIITAGSYVSVPVVYAGAFFGVKIIVHQQDVRPGLANKVMAPLAHKVTVAFKKSLADYGKKAILVGNPLRNIFTSINKYDAQKLLGVKPGLPIVLVVGGGTGALKINNLIKENINELLKFSQIMHITGVGKAGVVSINEGYYKFDFLSAEKMAAAYAVSDIVVSRCGLGALTELSLLSKPSILIPMPNSHQEENAAIFSEAGAAIVLDELDISSKQLLDNIKNLVLDEALKKNLGEKISKIIIKDANKKFVLVVSDLLK